MLKVNTNLVKEVKSELTKSWNQKWKTIPILTILTLSISLPLGPQDISTLFLPQRLPFPLSWQVDLLVHIL